MPSCSSLLPIPVHFLIFSYGLVEENTTWNTNPFTLMFVYSISKVRYDWRLSVKLSFGSFPEIMERTIAASATRGPTGKIRGSHYPKFRPIITRGVCIHTWGPQSISGKICQRVVLTVDVEEDDRWDPTRSPTSSWSQTWNRKRAAY